MVRVHPPQPARPTAFYRKPPESQGIPVVSLFRRLLETVGSTEQFSERLSESPLPRSWSPSFPTAGRRGTYNLYPANPTTMNRSFRVLVFALPLNSRSRDRLGARLADSVSSDSLLRLRAGRSPSSAGARSIRNGTCPLVSGREPGSGTSPACSAYGIALIGNPNTEWDACSSSVLSSGSAFAVQASATDGEPRPSVAYTIPQTGSFLLETIYTGNIAIFENLTLDLVSLRCIGDAESLCVD